MADRNTRLLQAIQPPGDLWVRVTIAATARDAGLRNQRIATWRRSPMIATGFKRDIGGCIARLRPPSAAHEDLGVRLSGAMVIAFADDVAIVHNDTADIEG